MIVKAADTMFTSIVKYGPLGLPDEELAVNSIIQKVRDNSTLCDHPGLTEAIELYRERGTFFSGEVITGYLDGRLPERESLLELIREIFLLPAVTGVIRQNRDGIDFLRVIFVHPKTNPGYDYVREGAILLRGVLALFSSSHSSSE